MIQKVKVAILLIYSSPHLAISLKISIKKKLVLSAELHHNQLKFIFILFLEMQ